MGLGIDLEAAVTEPYHAMQDAASCGRRRGCYSAACSACVENKGRFLLVSAIVALSAAFAIIGMFTLTYDAPSFSVHLTGYDGIDPGRPARVVTPEFDVTIRMNNSCIDSADVAVMYSGVALGWARVEPRDCAERRWERDVNVVARGGRVGLSQRLRDRMASEWRSGTLELDVDVKMYHEGHRADTDLPRNMIVSKVRMMEREQEPSLLVGEVDGQ